MNNFSLLDYHEEKVYKKSSIDQLVLVRSRTTNETALLRSFYNKQLDIQEPVNRLYNLQMRKNIAKLIPSMSKHQLLDETHYIYEDFKESIEETIDRKLLENSYFSFAEIYKFFNTLINGLAFLQVHNYTIDFSSQKLFITTKNILNCTEIQVFSKVNLEKEIYNFGLFLLHICTVKFPHSLKENYEKMLMTDKSMMEELVKSLEEIEERYSKEALVKQEDKIGFEGFTKTLRTIFFRKEKKNIDYVSLFIDNLYMASPNILEGVILKIDNQGI